MLCRAVSVPFILETREYRCAPRPGKETKFWTLRDVMNGLVDRRHKLMREDVLNVIPSDRDEGEQFTRTFTERIEARLDFTAVSIQIYEAE